MFWVSFQEEREEVVQEVRRRGGNWFKIGQTWQAGIYALRMSESHPLRSWISRCTTWHLIA